MNNISINEAESIFEPFWDGGESYPNNQKYSTLTNYTFDYKDGVIADIFQTWASVNISIIKQTKDDYLTTMQRKCRLNISEYDEFMFFGSVPKEIAFRIYCDIDGVEKLIIDTVGVGDMGEYYGDISGKMINSIRLEFNTKENGYSASLQWMGLANKEKREKMLSANRSVYSTEWEGCFNDEFEIKPEVSIYFGEEELKDLRNKISEEPFKKVMDNLRKKAIEYMKMTPENDIGEFIGKRDRRFIRDRDMKNAEYQDIMSRLAFVGIIDENVDMLKMACRMALSISHAKFWTEGFMGCFPGSTWHHRSFSEEVTLTACATVLDLAGSLLTWHGKNIIYDAIIMKGLPRLEADFKTIDYIRKMNQGIVFSTGRINALIALTHRYPRYKSWLLDAEADVWEMINEYVCDDGGVQEGPGYWNYTFLNILPVLYALARFHGLPISEYVQDSVKRTGEYALAMLSDIEDGTNCVPVNDAHTQGYHLIVSALFAQISDNEKWEKVYANTLSRMPEEIEKEFLILAHKPKYQPGLISRPEFIHLQNVGQTVLRQDSPLGMVHLHLVSGGPIRHDHNHGDKGSFIIEVDKKPIFIDRGVTRYNNPYTACISKSYNHNLVTPESEDGTEILQPIFNTIGGVVLKAEFKDGKLNYVNDVAKAWEEGIFKKNVRSITSHTPLIYTVKDEYEFYNPMISSFRLHTLGSIEECDHSFIIKKDNIIITVTPENYKPARYELTPDGYDEHGNVVNTLKLYIEKGITHNLVTTITIGS